MLNNDLQLLLTLNIEMANTELNAITQPFFHLNSSGK